MKLNCRILILIVLYGLIGVCYCEDCGKLTIGVHGSSSQGGDRTVEITEGTSLKPIDGYNMNNVMSRYKIDGYMTWEFYKTADFAGEPLFTASGPVGWTVVEGRYNDKVSSVKPVGNCWTSITSERLLIPLSDMETTGFEINTKEDITDEDVIDIEFLDENSMPFLSVIIGNDGLHLELDGSRVCPDENLIIGDNGDINDHYGEGVLSSGVWGFLKQQNLFTVYHEDTKSVFYEFAFDETCMEDFYRTGAVKFREDQRNGASVLYHGHLDLTGVCPQGHFVTDQLACQECPMGSFNDDTTSANTCRPCPVDTSFSARGSTSLNNCTNTQYFKDMEANKNADVETITNYNLFWILDPNIEVYLEIERLQKHLIGRNCYVIIYIESVELEIDLGMFRNFGGKTDGYIAYRLGDYDRSDTLEFQDVSNITITFRKKRIYVEVHRSGDKRKIIRNLYSETDSKTVSVSVSNKVCLNFVERQSYIKRIDEVIPTASPITNDTDDQTDNSDVDKLSVYFCQQSYYRGCEEVNIKLNETWSNFNISSIRILDIPKDRAINVTSNLYVTYTVHRYLVDNNLADRHSQGGFHLEGEGGSSIVAVEYVIYNEHDESDKKETNGSLVTKKPLIKEINDIAPTTIPVEEYDPEEEEVVQVKEIFKDIINYNIEYNETEETQVDDIKVPKVHINVWKPDFKGRALPVKALENKVNNYTENRNKTNVLGFLTYNGFTDVGITTSKKKKDKELESVNRNVDVDEDAMVETIKAFQKFNGYPETGELTETQIKGLNASRCGNPDTSYRENSDTLTCIEGTVQETDQVRKENCPLDRDIFLDICAHYPRDVLNTTEQIDEFLWNQGYYFEADVDFRSTRKKVSHIGIAFNYDNETREADYVFIQSEIKHSRLCFSYGTYKQGKRKEIKNVRTCVKYDKEQDVLRQFKIRLTVNPVETGRTYLSVNGKRIFFFKPSSSVRSSVYLFTLGGSNYRRHKVKIFTSRICRRNTHFETTRIRQKRGVTGFKWYPNGAAITYSFVNHSSHLGEQLTRQEIIKAINVYSSHGFKFKERGPLEAENANIVFMFMKETRHADGMKFFGAGSEKAHAYVPVHGEIHFNDWEHFSVSKSESTTNLFYVALHEMGHALGLSHSDQKDAIMTARYDDDDAYQKNDLDDEDLGWLRVHYGTTYDLQSTEGGTSGQLPFESVKGLARGANYRARVPIPTACLHSIEAAFYFYNRKGKKEKDRIYMMSHGYLWAYTASNFAMLKGYPKRAAEVFSGATGQIDAAFDTGIFVYIIVQQKVYIYEPYKYDDSVFVQPNDTPSPQTLQSLFDISETKVKSAFNLNKVDICKKNMVCTKTALIIDTEKYYKVSFGKSGGKDLVLNKIVMHDAEKIIGRKYGEHQFEAAFELRSNEVIQFNNHRDFRRRDLFPSALPTDFVDLVVDVPQRFQIDGWCIGST